MVGRKRFSKAHPRANGKGKSSGQDKPHLSMRDEARNTERHSLRPNVRLRDSAVGFVSAGNMRSEDPAMLTEFSELVLQERNSKNEQQPSEETPAQDEDEAMPDTVDPDEGVKDDTKLAEEPSQDPPEPLFFIDAEGDRTIDRPKVSSPKIRCDSPENSSDDEVVFSGRRRQRPVVITDDPVAGIAEARTDHTEPTQQHERASPSALSPHPLATPQMNAASSRGQTSDLPSPHSNTATRPAKTTRSSRRASKRRRFQSAHDDDDDAILADYIENMLENASLEEDSPDIDEIGASVENAPPETGDVWEEADDNEFEDAIEAERGSIGDMERDNFDFIENFLAEESIQESIHQIPGEASAHAYMAKHEMTVDDENLIFDEGDSSDDMECDVTAATSKGSSRGPNVVTRSRRAQQFPAAGALADALDEDPYGAFDIMDFDRPSLRKKTKGRRKVPDFDLSDTELELELQMSWESDRKKKKLKKQQREELRAQGLLGSKSAKKAEANAADIKFDEIKDEIRSFLLSDNERLPLTPMDKKYRKIVHELANALALGSMSKGKGAARFPILSKTNRTPSFDQISITKYDRLVSGNRSLRRIERGQVRHHKGPGAATAGVGGARGGTKPASYHDGEVVGASAPEIGVENKGRAMLEKMGWSMGTALGANHNKGILQPVTHVVKTNKAGLG